MKQFLISILACCLTCTSLWADEQKKVTLTNEQNKQTVGLSYLNIFVTLNQTDEESGTVTIELENLSESKTMILFDRSYTEKQAGKLSPKMQFDKTFGGTKGQRVITPCSMQLDRVLMFRPSDKSVLPDIRVENGSTKVTLPLYIAKFKGDSKLILLERQVIELDVETELKPSAEYTELSNEVENLETKPEMTYICTNKAHRPNADKQREALQEKIGALKERADKVIEQHGWSEGDGGYTRYNDLKARLDKVELKERDCGRHSKAQPAHQCAYCNLSLQQIFHRLDDLYKKIYSSGDRKAAKASVASQVEALYNCCNDTRCSKHASQWKKGGDYKTKINNIYNRINSL